MAAISNGATGYPELAAQVQEIQGQVQSLRNRQYRDDKAKVSEFDAKLDEARREIQKDSKKLRKWLGDNFQRNVSLAPGMPGFQTQDECIEYMSHHNILPRSWWEEILQLHPRWKARSNSDRKTSVKIEWVDPPARITKNSPIKLTK